MEHTRLKTKTPEFIETELDFCPRCGTVLPLPDNSSHLVKCKLCAFTIDVNDFDGKKTVSQVEFNRPETLIAGHEEAESSLSGPTIDRKCMKCGHEKMVYTTRQTRSADEGQTVFFTCPECRFQEIEYS